MLDIITALSQTSLPGILAFAGLAFIFFSIGGKLGAQIVTDDIKKRYAGIIGGVLLIVSLAMFAVSATIQLREKNVGKTVATKNEDAQSSETFRLRPNIPTNKPISQSTELEWTYSSPDSSVKCTAVNRLEYVFTIIGRDFDGEASVAKRKTILDLSKETCTGSENSSTQDTETHGNLEGIELLARKTADGIWIFDEFPGATEKQKYEMRIQGFVEPFSELPKDEIPIGRVMLFKDKDISLVLSTAFPGKSEGSVAVKFVRVIKERGPLAQLSVSMDISLTTLTEDNSEVVMKMSLNGGGRLLLSDEKILFTAEVRGIITAAAPNSDFSLAGPAKMNIVVKEL